MQFSRQTEKSTLLSNFQIAWMIALPGFSTLYATPDYDKVKEFSKEKLAPKLRYSPLIKKHFYRDDGQIVDAVLERRLMNGSRVIFRSLYNSPDRARGISADAICYDEVQDIDIDHFPVVDQCISHSPYKIRFYAGTPKTHENAMEVKWRDSTQFEWYVRCEACTHQNYLDLNVIGPTGPMCSRCQRPIDTTKGQWVRLNAQGRYPGYRVCQLMVPWINWQKDIIDKLETYSHEKFANEVLALAADSADHPVGIKDLMDCCEPNLQMLDYRPRTFEAPTFAAIDWGGGNHSYSVLVIGALHQGKFVVVSAKKYIGKMAEPTVQIRDMAQRCAAWNVQMVACDAGYGWTANQLMKEAYGFDRVIEVQYVHSATSYLRYDKGTSKFFAHRDKTLARLFNGIKMKKYVFPRWEEFRMFADDLLVIYSEYNEKNHTMRYDHPSSRPDDFAHALNLCVLLSEMSMGESLVREAVGQ